MIILNSVVLFEALALTGRLRFAVPSSLLRFTCLSLSPAWVVERMGRLWCWRRARYICRAAGARRAQELRGVPIDASNNLASSDALLFLSGSLPSSSSISFVALTSAVFSSGAAVTAEDSEVGEAEAEGGRASDGVVLLQRGRFGLRGRWGRLGRAPPSRARSPL